jgi:uncharacterized paraquat-inducible protein A
MKINLLNKSCPNCNSIISLNFYRNREEIIQCPNCKTLLTENPKRKMASSIVLFVGLFLLIGSATLRIPIYFGLLTLFISFGIAQKVIELMSVKKDLIIRNKQTNQISYVNNSDWKEIVNNSADKENNFEVLENLNI